LSHENAHKRDRTPHAARRTPHAARRDSLLNSTVGDDSATEPGIAYLEIALRLRKLAPWLVESYTGPSELAARVDAEQPPVGASELREQARALGDALDRSDLEEDRRVWLSAQLAALDTALAVLAGQRFSYRQLVERCHGVAPAFVAESRFAAAHELLADTLPGNGDVRERYQRWAASQRVPAERLLTGLRALAEELRRRTGELVGLPQGEEVVFELVRDKPWAGNADYLGDFRTRVRINQDLPISSMRLLELASHEAYPGHHTEQVCKEAHLIRRGRVELAVFLYPTPQALVAEGIGELALEALLGERADEVAAECLQPLGIPYDAETAAVYRQVDRALLPVQANLAMLLDEGRSHDEARAYARRWLLEDDKYVGKVLSSLTTRRWAPVESCYPEGLGLCRRFTDGDPARFRRLLQEQLTTVDLLPTSKSG